MCSWQPVVFTSKILHLCLKYRPHRQIKVPQGPPSNSCAARQEYWAEMTENSLIKESGKSACLCMRHAWFWHTQNGGGAAGPLLAYNWFLRLTERFYWMQVGPNFISLILTNDYSHEGSKQMNIFMFVFEDKQNCFVKSTHGFKLSKIKHDFHHFLDSYCRNSLHLMRRTVLLQTAGLKTRTS